MTGHSPPLSRCDDRCTQKSVCRRRTALGSVGPSHRSPRGTRLKLVEVAVIGTGWYSGIRSETLSRSALVDKLHICEIRPERLAEVKALTNRATATIDYQDIIRYPNISVVYVCTTPE